MPISKPRGKLKKSRSKKSIVCLVFLCWFFAGTLVWAADQSDVIVITAAEISALNVQHITDVLNQVPGVKAGSSSVAIRGSSKVRVLLDGRPINDPTSSHGGIKFDMVFLENVERIEVHRGKGGVKYGNDASGGVILITTRKIDTLNGNIKTYGGNRGTFSISSNCQVRKSGIGISLSAGHDQTDGYQVNNDKKRYRGGAKLSCSPAEDLNLVLSTDYVLDKRGLAGRITYPTPFARKESEMISTSFTADYKKINWETFYTRAENRNEDISRQLDNSITVHKIGQDVSSSMEIGNWVNLNYGGAFRWQQAESTRFSSRDENWFSLFGVMTKTLKSVPLTLSAGFRGNMYSEFDNNLNPEFKLCWKKQRWSADFSYSRVSNIPSMYQRYDETSTKMPSQNLDPEMADNLNFSFFINATYRLSAGISFYYNRIKDRISYVWLDNGKGSYENFGKVTYKGSDLSLNLKILESLSLKTTYSYLKAINEEKGLWMAAKPRHRIYADLFFKSLTDFSIILNLKYESRQYTRSDNKAFAKEYIIANTRMEYRPEWAKLDCGTVEIFAEIKNITDKTYKYGDGGLAPPLTWISGLNFIF